MSPSKSPTTKCHFPILRFSGTVRAVEIDTNHFKVGMSSTDSNISLTQKNTAGDKSFNTSTPQGNFPDSVTIEAACAPPTEVWIVIFDHRMIKKGN